MVIARKFRFRKGGRPAVECFKLFLHLVLFGGVAAGLIFGGMGCDSSSSGSSDTAAELASKQLQTPTFLAMVATSSDEPVANAIIEGLGVTADSGVATGSTAPDGGTWYKVQAPGYAPDYVRPIGDFGGKTLLEATLTPVDARAVYSTGNETVLQDDPADPAVTVTVPGDVFAEEAVFLELTTIDPLDLGPLFAGTGSGATLYPQFAFSIEASDANGEEANFLTGSTATVRVKDNGVLGADPVLAWFNPESGAWEELGPGMCRRVEPNWIEATLHHFSTYGGMGVNAPTGSDGGYNGAEARYRDALADWADQGGGDAPPQEVIDALEDYASAAEAFANANNNEVAKQRLLAVMAEAQLIGQDSVSNRLWQKAQDITRGIARELIDNPDCGRLREMMGCMAQCQALDLPAEAQELDNKIADLLDVCNNWFGTVVYTMPIENTHPDFPEYTKYSGPLTWTEFHEVVLSINPKNYNIMGDDLVSLIAQEVVHRVEDPNDCSTPDLSEVKIKGSPAMGDLFLTVDGSFKPGDRPVFTLNTPAKASGNVSLVFTMYSRYFDGDCNKEEIGPDVNSFPFQSMLVDQSPPITLEDMLNNGSYHDHGHSEIIKGNRQVSLGGSTFGNWPLPFTKVAVQWHFVQVKPALE